jgi:hypothetical protein
MPKFYICLSAVEDLTCEMLRARNVAFWHEADLSLISEVQG